MYWQTKAKQGYYPTKLLAELMGEPDPTKLSPDEFMPYYEAQEIYKEWIENERLRDD